MGLITCLCQNELPRPESHWTPLTILLQLGKDCRNRILRRVCLYTYTPTWIKMSKDSRTAKGLLQPFKGLLCCCRPLPLSST